MKKKWTKQEDSLLTRYYLRKRTRDVVQLFKNRSHHAVRSRAYHLKLSNKKSIDNRKYDINDIFFNIPNVINSYWAGFLAADGCINYHSNRIEVDLQHNDKPHLQKLQKALDYTGHIHSRIINNKLYTRLSFSSKIIKKDLLKNFNITSQKSLILHPPYLKNENHIRAFIRGYFDGDGCLTFDKASQHYVIGFCGTKKFLTWIKINLKYYITNVGNPSICSLKNTQCKSLRFGGRKQTKLIIKWLYTNSIDQTRLDRKFKLAMKAKEY